MSEQLRESLSAALDDAADEFELRRVLDETSRDDALRETFARYQLIKSTLRGEASVQTLRYRTQLRRRVREALDVHIEAVPDHVEDRREGRPAVAASGWRTGGLAAAVAFVAMVGVYVLGGGLDPAGGNPPVGTVSVPTTVIGTLPLPAPAPSSVAVLPRHQQFLVRHLQLDGSGGVLPGVRVIRLANKPVQPE